MTRGEWTLVLFVFGLVYSAGLLVRFGEWFGERVFRNAADPKEAKESGEPAEGDPHDRGDTH